ncbi:hypothetical protein H5410_049495 [Solanum commersonii]|uniref:Uncharacterized protein n=1 Tax=Solanum commersonii TaxID=4109 RepID=A0A9J5WUT9_SOLCO|nr:hypothetical protein H5410_049495 [Solanum commersonii]
MEPVCPERQLVPKGKRAHFQVRTSPRVGKPQFCQFSCVIVHGFINIQNSGVFLAETFHGRPLRPYLWIFGDPKFRHVFC